MTTYPARYKDRFGAERTTILNDGEALTMVVRGVQFQGNDFDMFEPQDVTDPAQLATFTFLHGSLCFCVIEADIPVPVVTPTGIVTGLLTFELVLGGPLPTGQMDGERLAPPADLQRADLRLGRHERLVRGRDAGPATEAAARHVHEGVHQLRLLGLQPIRSRTLRKFDLLSGEQVGLSVPLFGESLQ
jgi:hypothetical protein